MGSRIDTLSIVRVGLILLGLTLLAVGQYLFDETRQEQFARDPRLAFLRFLVLQREGPAIGALIAGSILTILGLWKLSPFERVTPTATFSGLRGRHRVVGRASSR